LPFVKKTSRKEIKICFENQNKISVDGTGIFFFFKKLCRNTKIFCSISIIGRGYGIRKENCNGVWCFQFEKGETPTCKYVNFYSPWCLYIIQHSKKYFHCFCMYSRERNFFT
jgi:hypothetical protein